MNLFVCEPYHTKLTPEACARRYRKARKVRGDLLGATMGIGSACMRCPVGAAHSAGRRPHEGQVVELRGAVPEVAPPKPERKRHTRDDPPRPRNCDGCGDVFQVMPPCHNQRYCSTACAERVRASRVRQRPAASARRT